MVRKGRYASGSKDPYKALIKNFGIDNIDKLFKAFKKLETESNNFKEWEQKCFNLPVKDNDVVRNVYGSNTNFIYEVFWLYNELYTPGFE